jgi:opacity protein-like surface antigen
MKRILAIAAMTTAGALATGPAFAADVTTADRIMNAVYADLGLSAQEEEMKQSRNGFFVGLHTGLGTESGLSPIAAGLSIPLDVGVSAESITANGYYVYTTDWSLGTYVGGGFGKFNLGMDPLMNPGASQGNFAYQTMAGVTYSFTPSMALGLEYRYTEAVQSPYLAQSTLPEEEENQSVTLRFDFLLN